MTAKIMRPDTFAPYTATEQAILDRVAAIKVTQLPQLSAAQAILDNWPKAESGPKPVFEYKLAATLCPFKRGNTFSEQTFLAMLLRECGSTKGEHRATGKFKSANGFGPACNYVWHKNTGLCAGSHPMTERHFTGDRYWLKIMPRGFKVIEAELAKLEASLPVKKPRKAVAKPADAVIAPEATEVAPEQTPTSEAYSTLGVDGTPRAELEANI